jgi:hypothetical protein
MPQVNTVAIFLILEALRAWISLAFFSHSEYPVNLTGRSCRAANDVHPCVWSVWAATQNFSASADALAAQI